MTTKKTKNLTIVLLLILCSAFLGGCATTSEHSNNISLLTAAGFKVRTPTTAKQKEIYAALPDQQVMARENSESLRERAEIGEDSYFYFSVPFILEYAPNKTRRSNVKMKGIRYVN